MSRRTLAVALTTALLGCVPRLGSRGETPQVDRFELDGASFRLVYLPEDAATASELRAVLQDVLPVARRWGDLRAAVTITVHPSHEELELAVHREDYDWLRAWARYATIDMQSPRTWSLFGADRRHFRELVLHELVHCVMYQNSSSDWSWPYKGIPLWFREGMASVTAEQGYRRPGVEAIFAYYEGSSPGAGDGGRGKSGRRRRSGDPLTDPDPLYQLDSDVVYGTAHLAFDFLLDRYGEGRVKSTLQRMRTGDSFAEAFERTMGISPGEFEREFRRYVVWQGWRPVE